MRPRLKILFDFDGTLCKVETIPYVASLLGVDRHGVIGAMTRDACVGAAGYAENLRKRVDMMKDVSVQAFSEALVPGLLRQGFMSFIRRHPEMCGVVSCNLDCWCVPVLSGFGVDCRFSKAVVSGGRVAGIADVLDKTEVVSALHDDGYDVAFVGDSANDIGAMRMAEHAFLLSNGSLPEEMLDFPCFVTASEEALVGRLETLTDSYLK